MTSHSIILLLLLGLSAGATPNPPSHVSTVAAENLLRPRQNMTVPGNNHMMLDDVDVTVANMWIFKEFGCSLQPESPENPYYLANPPIRQTITDGQVGIPLTLTMKVTDVNTCEPLINTYVDIWQANATGWYSNLRYVLPVLEFDLASWMTYNPMPLTALRGRYYTDEYGFVTFTTIFPGRVVPATIQEAPHINFIVHQPTIATNSSGFPEPPEALASGSGNFEILHSGQIFFDDALTALVNTYEPYSRYWAQPLVEQIRQLEFLPSPTHIVNANDTNYRAEYANGTGVGGKNIDPVAWYRFQSGIWAYIGIGVDALKTHNFFISNGTIHVEQ